VADGNAVGIYAEPAVVISVELVLGLSLARELDPKLTRKIL
jgi:hypothetical protein